MKTTLSNQQLFSLPDNLTDQLVSLIIIRQGSDRYLNDLMIALTASLVPTHAILSALSTMHALKTKISKRIQPLITLQVDGTTITTITTIRSATRDIFFTTKTDTAIAAVSSLHPNCRLIYKFHRIYSTYSLNKKGPVLRSLFYHK